MSKMITLKEKPRDIEEEYQQIKKRILGGVDEVIEIDQDLFTRIRIGVLEKDIPHEFLQIEYDECLYKMDQYGHGCPGSLFIDSLTLSSRFLKLLFDLQKTERGN